MQVEHIMLKSCSKTKKVLDLDIGFGEYYKNKLERSLVILSHGSSAKVKRIYTGIKIGRGVVKEWLNQLKILLTGHCTTYKHG